MMSTPAEAPVEIEIGADVSASVIWLHGLGADGHDFAGLVPELRLPAALGIRFVFPHAPYRPVTLNGGYVMRAWYDLGISDGMLRQNLSDLRESVAAVLGLIQREHHRGIPAARIVLAGFSQGGAVAVHAALRCPDRLAGAMALSAPVPAAEELVRDASPANAQLPIFLAHGMRDGMVPFALGEQTRTALVAAGYAVEWYAYDMEHTVSYAEIADIARFLSDRLA